ncbi:FAD-dependent monooxygenase [Actinophytocola glycyrrhizae]|uniref:FAD-dependent monooxygenase n=1 Tax=Actinophytocola glycyrrhizae TaxID=2044873 RepID=A0ABV9S9A8_9PSEU
MKVVICGAGITGLALAQRLAVLGWEVVVAEKAPGPRSQGYMIDFFGAGYDAAEAMGLLPRLRELGYVLEEARFVDANGRPRARLSFAQFARTVDGRLLSIMRPDLESALRESLPAEVDLRFATSITHIGNRADGVRVTLTDGEGLDADLLVGADGIHSAVRGMVFGEERTFLRHLGFHTAAWTFDDAAIRARVGDRFCLTDSVDRQLGLYGLRDGRVAAFAVHRTTDRELPADPRAALLAEYGGLGWVAPEALARCPPADAVYYDHVAQIEVPAWHRDRVVLAGDACAAVSLLAGQGASLGIAGAYLLADQLHRARTVADGLGSYERLWRPVMAEKQLTARNGARWFLPRSTMELLGRRAMLALSRLPGLEHLVARSLAGKPTAVITDLDRRSRDAGVPAWR